MLAIVAIILLLLGVAKCAVAFGVTLAVLLSSGAWLAMWICLLVLASWINPGWRSLCFFFLPMALVISSFPIQDYKHDHPNVTTVAQAIGFQQPDPAPTNYTGEWPPPMSDGLPWYIKLGWVLGGLIFGIPFLIMLHKVPFASRWLNGD